MGRPLTGGLSIVFAVFLMAVQDTVIKTMSGDMSLWQLFVLRSPVALVLLSLIALSLPRLSAGKAWRHALMPWALVRSLCVLLMYIFMYLSFPYLKLAEMGAAFYTAPIFTALMSALFLKDRVGLQGGLAVSLNIVLMVMGGVIVLGLRMMNLDPTVVAWQPFMLEDWSPLSAADWRLMPILALLICGISILLPLSYQIAPTVLVAIL